MSLFYWRLKGLKLFLGVLKYPKVFSRIKRWPQEDKRYILRVKKALNRKNILSERLKSDKNGISIKIMSKLTKNPFHEGLKGPKLHLRGEKTSKFTKILTQVLETWNLKEMPLRYQKSPKIIQRHQKSFKFTKNRKRAI